MRTTKSTVCVLAVAVLALATMVPTVASAHTHVFLGINLGGWLAPPPVQVYAPPVYYAPPPPPVYYPRPAYYTPPMVYGGPRVIYYPDRDRDWHRGWRRGWDGHRDDDWHHGWHHGDH